jgi:hypothetical protein
LNHLGELVPRKGADDGKQVLISHDEIELEGSQASTRSASLFVSLEHSILSF